MDEIYNLIGMKHVDFVGQNGSPVKGWNFFFTYEDPKITGMGIKKVFIPDDRFAKLSFVPEVGSYCSLVYGPYNKVVGFSSI